MQEFERKRGPGSPIRGVSGLKEGLRLTIPLLGILLAYSFSRSLAARLTPTVTYSIPLEFETRLFGAPLAVYFQYASSPWLDAFFSIIYSLHPAYFILLLLFMLFYDVELYKHALASTILSSSIAVIIYVAWPVAPPWIAVPGLTKTPNYVLDILGLNKIVDPNPYAAMPSMHVAYSLLFVYYSTLFAERLGWALWARGLACFGGIIAVLMPITVIYTGNHYLLDVLAGLGLATSSIKAADAILGGLSHSHGPR